MSQAVTKPYKRVLLKVSGEAFSSKTETGVDMLTDATKRNY